MLARPGEFARLMEQLECMHWIVDSQPPPAEADSPAAVIHYLTRYVVGVPISDARIISDDEQGVTLWFKNYRRSGQRETMTVTGEEFVQLFALHLLPPRLHRVRYCGIFAQCKRGRLLPVCRDLLQVQPEENKTAQQGVDEWALDDSERLPRFPTYGEPALVWTHELPGRRAPNAFDSSKPAPRLPRYRPTAAGPTTTRGP